MNLFLYESTKGNPFPGRPQHTHTSFALKLDKEKSWTNRALAVERLIFRGQDLRQPRQTGYEPMVRLRSQCSIPSRSLTIAICPTNSCLSKIHFNMLSSFSHTPSHTYTWHTHTHLIVRHPGGRAPARTRILYV